MANVEVDDTPLKPSINRNKEVLKLKLENRRPITILVDQGLIPSPSTPPAVVKLERARMGDMLKAKIQQRPTRLELVRQHILEEPDVAPLLAEKQRMLKRARLADSLNDHLIHRPGPLELVKKNILHADESIEQAIKDGKVPFKSTSEGATPGPPIPTKYSISTEDSNDSSSDVSSPSVVVEEQLQVPESVAEFKAPLFAVPLNKGVNKSSKGRKKTKAKGKVIKFHEYRGPPSATKSTPPEEKRPPESSYELLLQQQQLFLQWQLENTFMFPKLLLPAVPPEEKTFVFLQPLQPQEILDKPINDWKVNELKSELKKRSLPVSGSKCQLVERLQGHLNKEQGKSALNYKVKEKLKEEERKDNILKTQEEPSFEKCLKGLVSEQETNIKSQMVDDVLEILIRNGELPPSASTNPTPPPPPPLPPTTFSITLPTEINFRRPEPKEQPLIAPKDSPISTITHASSILTLSSPTEPKSSVIDELLNGTLELPMDTEYADWLEGFSSETGYLREDPKRDPFVTDPLLSSSKGVDLMECEDGLRGGDLWDFLV